MSTTRRTIPGQTNPAASELPTPRVGGLGSHSNDLTGTADFEDLSLVLRIRAAGPDARIAWDILIDRYQDRIYAVCLRMVSNPEHAADLTQDCLVKIIQGLGGYDGRSKLSTWVIRVCMNTCLSWLRGQKLRRHASLDAALQGHDQGVARPSHAESDDSAPGEKPGTSENHAVTRSETRGRANKGYGRREWQQQTRELEPDVGVQQDERRHLVAAALAALPTDQRAILVLRDVQGLDYEQIAEVLALNVGTVKSRLFRSRLALREAVELMERATPRKKDDSSTP